MLRLPLRPSRPAKVKKVVTTVSMAASSSVRGSAAISVPKQELMSTQIDLTGEKQTRTVRDPRTRLPERINVGKMKGFRTGHSIAV